MTNAMHNFRKNALCARREMSAEKRRIASKTICQKVTSSRDFLSASIVACFLPMYDEVDVRIIIESAWRANKRIFVPITRSGGEMFFREIRPNTTLLKNKMNIWEPASGDFISPRDLQLVVTPTVAFDSEKHRIGMGGGYYDRCFSYLRYRKHWLKPKLLGVAFSCQEVEKISPNLWDIPLYKVFHEEN